MNIFRSDGAPYVMALLVSVLGWYVSHIVAEIEDAKAISYAIVGAPGSGDARVRVKNISRAKTLSNIQLSITCKPFRDCFVDQAARTSSAPAGEAEAVVEPEFGRITYSAPISPAATVPGRQNSRQFTVTTTLPAGAAIELSARLRRPGDDVLFIYTPDAVKPLDLYIVDAHSSLGFLLEHYFVILFGSFLVLLALFLLWLLGSLVAILRRSSDGKALSDPGACGAGSAADPAAADRRAAADG